MQVDLIDHMGSDLTVVNAARVSFDKTTSYREDAFGWHLEPRDAKLLEYLAKHNHWTPFAHCAATFRIKAPLFVARQLGKHQVGLVWNEVSRRYVDSEPEFYEPREWRRRAENVKQGSGDALEGKDHLNGGYAGIVGRALGNYQGLLDQGVCPEQARMVLPQSMYTEWYWTGSLAAFARVCNLRLDPHTQRETQEIAKMLGKHMERLFPKSWAVLIGGSND
jgi:thymidylate synthase (FAD)